MRADHPWKSLDFQSRGRRGAARDKLEARTEVLLLLADARREKYRPRLFRHSTEIAIVNNRANAAEWSTSNPDKVKEKDHRRRAKKLGSPGGGVTAQDWREILAVARGRCYYCDQYRPPLTMDHVVALANGGVHSKENIVAACKSCNSRKHTKSAEEFLRGLT